MMLLIHCPNCQHDNTPGERFCAKCGVPLDLKPCPQCGKVDQLTARACSGCGAEFPPLVVAHVDEGIATAAPPPSEPEPLPATPESRPTQGALPLIIVAIVAGGIPLLWMNRAHIPLPKAWQVQGPNATGSAVSPVAPPEAASPPPAAKADPVAGAAEPIAAPLPEPARAPTAAPATKASARQAAARPAPAHSDGPAAARTEAARPCTEALTALGLCNSAAERK